MVQPGVAQPFDQCQPQKSNLKNRYFSFNPPKKIFSLKGREFGLGLGFVEETLTLAITITLVKRKVPQL